MCLTTTSFKMASFRLIFSLLQLLCSSWYHAHAYTTSDPMQNRNIEHIKSNYEKSVRQQFKSQPQAIKHDHSPLSPPFPNGLCGGTVITLPGKEMYSDKSSPGLLGFMPLPSMSNLMLSPRDISVWLPKEYNMAEYRSRHFPILYCHDGQNAMEDSSSWTGSSWRLIGALSRMQEHEMLHTETPPIVVLIPSADGDLIPGLRRRHAEYGDITLPFSQAHGEFVATKLHPYIMNRFRVMEGPEHASTIGSSLGGQASLQLVLRYPTLFGNVAMLSPCFQAGTIAAVMANLVTPGVFSAGKDSSNDLRDMSILLSNDENSHSNKSTQRKNHKSLHSKRIYLDNGGDHDESRVPMFDVMDHFTMNDRWWNPGYFWLDTHLQPTIDAVRWALDRGGVDYRYEKYPGGRHNERGWAQRIHRPLLHLYGKKQ